MLSPAQQPGNTSSSDMANDQLHSALKTGHASFEWNFLKADKLSFQGLVSLSTIQIEEQQLVLAVVNDISNLKQRQAELQKNLSEAQVANQENSKTVDEFTETIQTSLDPVVQSVAAIITAENLTGEQKRNLEIINRSCRTLIDTMNYRKELSHVADESGDVKYSPCNLHELIHDLDHQFTQRAKTKKLFFAVSYAQYQSAHNLPKLVGADEQKVRKVLEIVLGYALAHTEKGRLGLHAAHQSEKGDSVSITFELAYTGKAKEDERLSQVFGTEDNEINELQSGLSLAQRYIQMMDGTVHLEYRRSNVTALTISLPFKKVDSKMVLPVKNAEPKAGAA